MKPRAQNGGRRVERGFLLDVFQRSLNGKAVLYGLGRLENGDTFGLVERRVRPHFFIRASDLDAAKPLIGGNGVGWADSAFRTMDGQAAVRLYADHERPLRRLAEKLGEHGVRSFEADLPLSRRYLIDRSVTGPVSIDGAWKRGREVDWVTVDPEISPTDREPELLSLFVDIETTPEADRITAISLVAGDLEEVHVLGCSDPADPGHLHSHPTERELLAAFRERVREIDPDIITGWNVVDFDLRVLLGRLGALGIGRDLGRSSEESVFREGRRYGGSRVRMPGRQVLDALHLVRRIPQRFDDYRLDTVAQAVLGRGKLLHASDRKMPEVIMDAYEHDRQTFAEYCLEDARLVRDILAETDLLKLTLRRSILTGLRMERAWGSVTAFDFLYLTELHKRGIVAATEPEDPQAGGGAAGGWVISPEAGLHRHIVVFDFKSLYPSIIRTFNIDPLSRVRAAGESDDEVIVAPNSARFGREEGILPEDAGRVLRPACGGHGRGRRPGVLHLQDSDELVLRRHGNKELSLCRPPAGGRHHRLRAIPAEVVPELPGGARLFVFSMATRTRSSWTCTYRKASMPQTAAGDAMRLCAEVNDVLSRHVREEYRVESHLELEFEHYYRRFLLPPSRGQTEKGRAKGYAGSACRRTGESGSTSSAWRPCAGIGPTWPTTSSGGSLTFSSTMPTARQSRPSSAALSADLRAAKLDGRLVYRRALRKPVEQVHQEHAPTRQGSAASAGGGFGRRPVSDDPQWPPTRWPCGVPPGLRALHPEADRPDRSGH